MTDDTQQPRAVQADEYTVWIAEERYKYDLGDKELTPEAIAEIREDLGTGDIWEETWLVPVGTNWTNTPTHNVHELLERSMRLAE